MFHWLKGIKLRTAHGYFDRKYYLWLSLTLEFKNVVSFSVNEIRHTKNSLQNQEYPHPVDA